MTGLKCCGKIRFPTGRRHAGAGLTAISNSDLAAIRRNLKAPLGGLVVKNLSDVARYKIVNRFDLIQPGASFVNLCVKRAKLVTKIDRRAEQRPEIADGAFRRAQVFPGDFDDFCQKLAVLLCFPHEFEN